jgi:hypothetical protein
VQADDTDDTIGGVGDDCIATTDACVDTDVTTTSNACVGTSVATSDACVGEDVDDGHSFIWQTIFDLPPF